MPPSAPLLPDPLRGFVDDELLRAPLLADQALGDGAERVRAGSALGSPRERTLAADLLQALKAHRPAVVAAWIASLRRQAVHGVARSAALAAGASLPPVDGTRDAAGRAAGEVQLALVDEEDVAADVEISHTIDAVRSHCEYELRELQTYVSALVGDMDVTRDHNPFGAEVHARALWDALQALPVARGHRLVLMRHTGTALPPLLRRAFAATTSRLEAAGIEPAAHRTVILPTGSRRARRPDSSLTPDLSRLREAVPRAARGSHGTALPLPAPAGSGGTVDAVRGSATGAAGASDARDTFAAGGAGHRGSGAPADANAELFAQLMEALLTDPRLAPDLAQRLARLQPAMARLVTREPRLLDDHAHAAWRLVDRIAFQGDLLPPVAGAGANTETREQALRSVDGIVDHVAREPDVAAPLFAWAQDRLLALERARLQRRLQAVAERLPALERQDALLAHADGGAAVSLHGTLDVGQMDTVPAALLDAGPPPPHAQDASARAWIQRLDAGDWLRLFIDGRWAHAQLLWSGERGEVLLLADADDSTHWAMRRRAMVTLLRERLLGPLAPRSLLVDAARRVMRRAARRTSTPERAPVAGH